jgi:hypothetical protein
MAVRYITTIDFRDLARDDFEEDERWISTAEHNGLGALRGFIFAMLIEGALVLLCGVGWELWRTVR